MQVYSAYFFVILINHFYLVDYKKAINTKKSSSINMKKTFYYGI